MYNLVFYISSSAVVLSVLFGLSLFYWWLATKRRYPFVFYFGLALILRMLLKFPGVLANLQSHFVQYNTYPLLFIGIFCLMLSYLFFHIGLTYFGKIKLSSQAVWLMKLWFVFALIYFAWSLMGGGRTGLQLPLWPTNLFFFMPFLVGLWLQIHHIKSKQKTSHSHLSYAVWLLMGAITFDFLTYSLYLFVQLAIFPSNLWFLGVISSAEISLLQLVATVLYFLGFSFLAAFKIDKPKTL